MALRLITHLDIAQLICSRSLVYIMLSPCRCYQQQVFERNNAGDCTIPLLKEVKGLFNKATIKRSSPCNHNL